MVFTTELGRAVPVGREEMDLKNRGVSSTYTLKRGDLIFTRVKKWDFGCGQPGWQLFRGSFQFVLRCLGPGLLPGGDHYMHLAFFRDG